jgi:hypothetical protein
VLIQDQHFRNCCGFANIFIPRLKLALQALATPLERGIETPNHMKDLIGVSIKLQVVMFMYYSSLIAPTGQDPSQAPQEIHSSLPITYLLSPAEMQDTGHSPSQAPQEMQLSLITYAIMDTPPL